MIFCSKQTRWSWRARSDLAPISPLFPGNHFSLAPLRNLVPACRANPELSEARLNADHVADIRNTTSCLKSAGSTDTASRSSRRTARLPREDLPELERRLP